MSTIFVITLSPNASLDEIWEWCELQGGEPLYSEEEGTLKKFISLVMRKPYPPFYNKHSTL